MTLQLHGKDLTTLCLPTTNNLEFRDDFLSDSSISPEGTSVPTGQAYQESLVHLNKKAIKHLNKGGREGSH